jgi:hypothetical protein
VFWDNLNVSDTIQYMDNNDYINDISESTNIFDSCSIRKISISTILEKNDLEEIDNYLSKMEKYNAILINIDYIPNNNKIVNTFYKKRINQIYNYFSDKLPNTKFYLSNNYKKI